MLVQGIYSVTLKRAMRLCPAIGQRSLAFMPFLQRLLNCHARPASSRTVLPPSLARWLTHSPLICTAAANRHPTCNQTLLQQNVLYKLSSPVTGCRIGGLKIRGAAATYRIERARFRSLTRARARPKYFRRLFFTRTQQII